MYYICIHTHKHTHTLVCVGLLIMLQLASFAWLISRACFFRLISVYYVYVCMVYSSKCACNCPVNHVVTAVTSQMKLCGVQCMTYVLLMYTCFISVLMVLQVGYRICQENCPCCFKVLIFVFIHCSYRF